MKQGNRNQHSKLLVAVCVLAGLLGALVLSAVLFRAIGTPRREYGELQIQIGATTSPNDYDPEAFYTQEGFLRYSAGEHLVGIDVSAHQGLIDWQLVAESGVEFAIIRAGYRGSSKGLLYEDETFRSNIEGAKAAGIETGVYFFSQARNVQEAREEAEFLLSLLQGEEIELPVFYDWEFIEGSERIGSPAEIPMTDCAVAFCKVIKSAGYEAGVYFNQTYGYYHLDLTKLQNYTLWLAEYGETPTFAYHFDCLQYTDSGTVAGIETAVDLDLWIEE